MEETLKSLADLPDVGTTQEPEQSNQQEQNQRPLSKYAAKQRRRSFTEQGPREQNQNHRQHEIRRSAQLQDTEKWMAVVRLATSLDQISAKVENIENRLNALVLPETPAVDVDVETLRKNLWEDAAKQANCTVSLITVRMEEQCQDLRERLRAIQTQITDDTTAIQERVNTRLTELFVDTVDTRDLIRELMRRVGDPADTPLASRLREVQYLTKQLELQKEKEQEEAPQDRKHWLPRWACQLLFDAEQIHVTDHGVWTETRVGDKIDFGGSSLLELWKKIRAARRAYKVQQKIAALQAKLDNTAAK